MKVLLINGSPHQQGNTATALAEVARQLAASANAMSWVEMLAGRLLERNLSLQFGGFGSESQMDFWEEGQGAYFWTSTEGKNKDRQFCVIDAKG